MSTNQHLSKDFQMSELLKSRLLGTLLGDGSLRRPPTYANYLFEVWHCKEQAEYMKHLRNLLNEVMFSKMYFQKDCFISRSAAHPEFTALHKLLYKDGTKYYKLGRFKNSMRQSDLHGDMQK